VAKSKIRAKKYQEPEIRAKIMCDYQIGVMVSLGLFGTLMGDLPIGTRAPGLNEKEY